MEWNPQGRRKRGRQKQSWRRTVIKELENIGRTWGEAKQMTDNRVRWRAMVARGAKRIEKKRGGPMRSAEI